MSLLDVLKYPLSNPPTPSELAALPTAILINYNISKDQSRTSHITEVYTALNFLKHFPEEVNIIRHLILEYDEPIRCT